MYSGPGTTRGISLTASPKLVADPSLHRKTIALSNPGTSPIWIALGNSPKEADYFQLGAKETFNMGKEPTVYAIWAKGPGSIIVMGQVVDNS